MVSSWHGGGRSGGGQLVRGEKADLLVPVLGWASGVETSRQGGELASGTEKLGSWSQVGGGSAEPFSADFRFPSEMRRY